ncbi:hypothetical protein TWF694_011246 [Orbilia ellipsospora]|uniref:Uncharacterized protein n=1 Tax=Orbilia ellipsospora TaxID=2528407 RepID=A0AAV9X8T9_9PEZI
MSATDSTGPSATLSDDGGDESIAFSKQYQTGDHIEVETPREYLMKRLPTAPLILDEAANLLNVLDTFYTHCFAFNLVSNLAELPPQERLNPQATVSISDIETIKILGNLIDEFLLNDLLDNCDLLWDVVIAPRLQLEDIEALVKLRFEQQEKRITPVEDGDVKDTGSEEHFEERDLDDSYSDDGLLHYDDEGFEWPLKPTQEWKQGIKDLKARKKAAKDAPVRDLFAEMDKTLPPKCSSEPEQGLVENSAHFPPPDLQMPTLSISEMNNEVGILYGATSFDGWIDGPCCPFTKRVERNVDCVTTNVSLTENDPVTSTPTEAVHLKSDAPNSIHAASEDSDKDDCAAKKKTGKREWHEQPKMTLGDFLRKSAEDPKTEGEEPIEKQP